MPDFKNVPLSFNVTLYGNLEQFDDSKSKCRVRIFYKGMNRNRTYISEDFAKQLIASLPYAPVKGIFNSDEVDFEGHGEKNSEGKIYGLVMAEPNFAWEDHMDADGVIRTYACADVILYTSLYNEAKLIPGSSQSMEINPFTYKGEWKIWPDDGQPYYYFESGSLFGLQALGTNVEPCFEGAAFYNLVFEKLKNDFQPLMDYINNTKKKEESKEMELEQILFRLSDRDKANLIWSAINPNYSAEDGWKINYWIIDVFDEYALVVNEEDGSYSRAYYTKNEDSVTIDKMETCYILDVTEAEKNALDAMKNLNSSYEEFMNAANENINKISEMESTIATLNAQLAAPVETPVEEPATNNSTEEPTEGATEEPTEEPIEEPVEEPTEEPTTDNTVVEPTKEEPNAEYETKVAEYEAKIAALEAEKVGLENEKNNLISEKETLVAFKTSVEKEKKTEILNDMNSHLTEELIEKFTNDMDKYTVDDFKKEVYAASVENDATIFNKKEEPDLFFKGNQNIKPQSGMEALLEKFKNKNGGNR